MIDNKIKLIVREELEDAVRKRQEIEDSWKEFEKKNNRDSSEDQMNIELDRNLNSQNLDGDMAHAYTMNDPMYKKVTGSTLRNRIKSMMGNELPLEQKCIKFNENAFKTYVQSLISESIRKWLRRA